MTSIFNHQKLSSIKLSFGDSKDECNFPNKPSTHPNMEITTWLSRKVQLEMDLFEKRTK
jgi:hypothetical protein